jgi:hypothetical protein
MIVIPPDLDNPENLPLEKNLFLGEVKRIVNFAALADNRVEILYGELKNICFNLGIDLFGILETEEEQYN